jgi:hypothetical protein
MAETPLFRVLRSLGSFVEEHQRQLRTGYMLKPEHEQYAVFCVGPRYRGVVGCLTHGTRAPRQITHRGSIERNGAQSGVRELAEPIAQLLFGG